MRVSPACALLALAASCSRSSSDQPAGADAAAPACVPLANVSASCPADWPAAMVAKAAFCAKEAPLFGAFLSTSPCRGRLRYTRSLFDGGPRYCVYDPTTLKLAGYRAVDGKAMFEQTSCGVSTADFDDQGCAGESCGNERPDASTGSDGGLPLAEVRCDTVDQTCPEGRHCDFTCDNGLVVIACVPDLSTAAEAGETCGGLPDAGARLCGKGTGCFADSLDPATCHRYCRADTPCPAGTTCDTMSTLVGVCAAGNRRLPAGICH